ncbi:hypothetical protein, partial [Streptomyces sp. NPDC058045]|uniref:hypothetical protein n=1 Tax=Streptomyces sp. NPDC058045 TaxID=3346311 RepID=UPI0036F15226
MTPGDFANYGRTPGRSHSGTAVHFFSANAASAKKQPPRPGSGASASAARAATHHRAGRIGEG